ncbi:MAG: FAD-dependent oxidoreductase [Deinococcus sp.]|uniref:FAD-dependent oxidoreductase n=1 Tax=Deinococcus sp. TaxID=47478 RepID=UPI0026DAEC47|nr:FAD-binding oxidoreductase [Deinococcus sp.]MDO4246434.1 FAD-dependent oxidoreductase [Deinococcus sp.]
MSAADSASTAPRSQVWAHVGQPFTPDSFDIVVVGAGRMGAACALYLRQLAPHLSLLLVEEGGLPNEEGATILAPGVWTAFDVPEGQEAAAEWTREQLLSGIEKLEVESRPLVELLRDGADTVPSSEALAHAPEALALLDPQVYPCAHVDDRALTYRPGQLALQAAQQAIRLGANLLLNTRAEPGVGQVKLHRLTVTNTHQIVVHETRQVRARAVVVAAGAAGPVLVEHGVGLHTRHGRAYVQYPRLNLPTSAQTPVLRAGGLTLRPQNDGLTLIPPIHHRDPQGYQPAGGQLTGVLTGLRREVLEDLVALMDGLPALSSDRLELGRSSADIAGAWVSLPGGQPDTIPTAEQPAPGLFLLLGGPRADTLGLATAHALATEVVATLD